METIVAYTEPHTPAEWEKWRQTFTQLYWHEDKKLREVMDIMKLEHGVKASEKQYKTRVKAWGLRKYLKEEEAQQIVLGEAEPNEVVTLPAFAADSEEARKRAEKSLKRKQARKRAETQAGTAAAPVEQTYIEPPVVETTTALVPFGSSPYHDSTFAPQTIQFSTVADQFLRNLRAWTHDAFSNGYLDKSLPQQRHHGGRQVARRLSSDLMAGINLFNQGKGNLAFTYWDSAFRNLKNPDLFDTWYHETPIRLLFEVSRVAHNGHKGIANALLQAIKDFAHTFLRTSDARRNLFGVFASLDQSELKDLYRRAARVMYDGLESRLEKGDPLLYEVRLNRALDMLYYDPSADLSDWLPPIEEVDQATGPNSPYSIYFMLLEAYRLVARDRYEEADDICARVRDRLNGMPAGSIDNHRLGLAYRRLGRLQYTKHRYADARRSFNTALRKVKSKERGGLSASILIEIYQCQESMAKALGDQEDADLWRETLRQLEQQTKNENENSMDLVPVNGAINGVINGSGILGEVGSYGVGIPLTSSPATYPSTLPGSLKRTAEPTIIEIDDQPIPPDYVYTVPVNNKKRRLSPSPARSPTRSMTF